MISIIIPIYNVKKYLTKCIESVRNQTYRDIEIICVDDGSTDGCSEICDYYQKIDSRIKVIHQENGGVVSARKSGLKVALGKYVGFVDSDDWIEPRMYEDMLYAINENQVDIVESGIIDSEDNHEKTRAFKLKEGCYKGSIFINNIIPRLIYDGNFFDWGVNTPYLWNKLFKREYITECYMQLSNEETIYEDFVSVYSYLIKHQSVYIMNKSYYHYRVVRNSLKRRVLSCPQKVLKLHIDVITKVIEKSEFNTILKEQLNYFILYFLLMFSIDVFDTQEEKLIPYSGVKQTDKVILYGAGATGINLYRYLTAKTNIKIVNWVDKNYEHFTGNYVINSPGTISFTKNEIIIISVLRKSMVNEIIKDLTKMEVKTDRIRWISDKYLEKPELLLRSIEL